MDCFSYIIQSDNHQTYLYHLSIKKFLPCLPSHFNLVVIFFGFCCQLKQIGLCLQIVTATKPTLPSGDIISRWHYFCTISLWRRTELSTMTSVCGTYTRVYLNPNPASFGNEGLGKTNLFLLSAWDSINKTARTRCPPF